MSAPAKFDLYVIYDPAEVTATATTLRCPSAQDREARLRHMEDSQAQGGLKYQLVPGLRFRRFGAACPLAHPSPKIRDTLERMNRPPVPDVFMDPRTGQWVSEGWRPGTPVQDLSSLIKAQAAPGRKRSPRRSTR